MKTFSWASGLSRHMVQHKNISIPCYVCKKAFKRKDKLREHILRTHDTFKSYSDTVRPSSTVTMQNNMLWNKSENCAKNNNKPPETLNWNANTDPNDLVETIKTNMRMGLNCDIYINTLRDMGIIA